MLSEMECREALDDIYVLAIPCQEEVFEHRSQYLKERYILIKQLIKEHFELVELLKPHGYGMLSAEEFEHWISYICKHNADNDMIIMYQNEQLEQIKNPQPYKFEDLKVGIWVWDDKEKVCFQCNPMISTDMAQCVTYMSYWYNDGEDYDKFHEEYDEFEENRFYPLTKALQYQGKEDE